MTKNKRSNYLIDKPFQIGFISRYVVIIIMVTILVFLATGTYYWIVSSFGKFKLDTAVTYSKRGYLTFNGKKIYNYDKEKIQLYEDVDEFDQEIYRCYRTYEESTTRYKTGDIIETVDVTGLEPVIGKITKYTTRFKIIFFPLLWAGIVLVLVISIFSLFFSHRMAGPIYRLRISLDKMLSGDNDFKIRVRKNDFFVNIIERLEKLRQKTAEKKGK